MNIENPRLFYLTITTIVVAIIYMFIAFPVGGGTTGNICEDRDFAMENYAKYKNDTTALKNFAIKRNNTCKKLLLSRQNDTQIYKKMDNCDLFESFSSSSGFLINLALQYKDYDLVKKELDDAPKYIQPYEYCPQYEGVNAYYNQIKEKNIK